MMLEVKQRIEEIFDGPVDVLADIEEKPISEAEVGDRKPVQVDPRSVEAEIINLLLRRPCTVADIAKTLEMKKENVAEVLEDMKKKGTLIQKIHGGKKYFKPSMLQEENI